MPGSKRSVERSMRRMNDNIKLDLQIKPEGMDKIQMTQ